MNPQTPTLCLVILAAGMGSRYGGLKQIDPVGPNGEAVLDYSVYEALRAGFTKIVFIIRRDFEAVFREKIGRRFDSLVDVRYVRQELTSIPQGHQVPLGREKPWGTGHAVWCAANEVSGPFGVINADDYYGVDAFKQMSKFLRQVDPKAHPVQCCLVGYPLANTLSEHGTVSRGVCEVDSSGRLTSIQEWTAIERQPSGARQILPDGSVRTFTGAEIVSMNCWGFSPGVFASLEKQFSEFLELNGKHLKSEFYIPSAVSRMIVEGKASASVLTTSSEWFGVTYKEDRARVSAALQSMIRAGVYPERLWQ